MIAHLSPTNRTVLIAVDGAAVAARVWQGTTSTGIEMVALIIGVGITPDADDTEFERELARIEPLKMFAHTILDDIDGDNIEIHPDPNPATTQEP